MKKYEQRQITKKNKKKAINKFFARRDKKLLSATFRSIDVFITSSFSVVVDIVNSQIVDIINSQIVDIINSQIVDIDIRFTISTSITTAFIVEISIKRERERFKKIAKN